MDAGRELSALIRCPLEQFSRAVLRRFLGRLIPGLTSGREGDQLAWSKEFGAGYQGIHFGLGTRASAGEGRCFYVLDFQAKLGPGGLRRARVRSILLGVVGG